MPYWTTRTSAESTGRRAPRAVLPVCHRCCPSPVDVPTEGAGCWTPCHPLGSQRRPLEPADRGLHRSEQTAVAVRRRAQVVAAPAGRAPGRSSSSVRSTRHQRSTSQPTTHSTTALSRLTHGPHQHGAPGLDVGGRQQRQHLGGVPATEQRTGVLRGLGEHHRAGGAQGVERALASSLGPLPHRPPQREDDGGEHEHHGRGGPRHHRQLAAVRHPQPQADPAHDGDGAGHGEQTQRRGGPHRSGPTSAARRPARSGRGVGQLAHRTDGAVRRPQQGVRLHLRPRHQDERPLVGARVRQGQVRVVADHLRGGLHDAVADEVEVERARTPAFEAHAPELRLDAGSARPAARQGPGGCARAPRR